MLLLATSALASTVTVRGDRPTRRAVHNTERVWVCKAEDWSLVKQEPADPAVPGSPVGSTWLVKLCGHVQLLTISRTATTWGYHTDVELRGLAPEELGCTDLEYAYVDPMTRRVTGCGEEATYHDSGPAWVRTDPDAPLPVADARPLVLGDEPVLGDHHAPVVVVSYTDFGCPHCKPAFEALRGLAADPRVQVRSRSFPLDGTCNPIVRRADRPQVCEAALAARCADAQGRFWDYAAALFADQADLGTELFFRTADGMGLDPVQFRSCLASPSTRAALDADVQSGVEADLPGTPTTFVGVGGRWVEVCIEADLATTVRRLADGSTAPAEACAD